LLPIKVKLFEMEVELTILFSEYSHQHLVYLHSLSGFVQFIAGSRSWLRHLETNTEEILTTSEKIKNMTKSLKGDVLKDRVERHSRGEDQLDLEPKQVASYLEGDRPRHASNLLQRAASGISLTRVQSLQVRNSLCLQLLLTNAKRVGDVTHLRREAVLNAKSDKGSDIEVEVSTTIILEKNGYG
jgi:hypothetical protein